MTRWETFRDKYLGKISTILSWIFNVAGLVLAILSFIKNDADLGWGVVLSLIIFNSIFLIIISIYETLLFKRGATLEKDIIKEKDEAIEQLKLQLKLSNNQSDKLRYYYKYIIATLNKFSTQLLEVNYKLQESNNDIDQMVEEYNSNNNHADDKFESFIANLKSTAYNDYEQSMLKEFNHFLSNITNKLKLILDISLKEKDCMLETSISVKQFSRIVYDPDDILDIGIITTFRDSQTYSQGKREIGEKIYYINKNTDFLYCLTHSYFLKNNIQEDDRTYDNEHKGFLEYYNCAIVVPIKCEFPDSTHIYGYLTCDILNDDFFQQNLLDDKMAEIMEATANIMGLYFDDMDFQWDHVLNYDFLDTIFNFKNKTKK